MNVLLVIYYIVLILFLLKILINIVEPYVLLWKLYKTKAPKGNISILPIEVVFWLALIILTLFIKQEVFYFGTMNVIIYGLLLILISYAPFLIGSSVKFAVDTIKKKKKI